MPAVQGSGRVHSVCTAAPRLRGADRARSLFCGLLLEGRELLLLASGAWCPGGGREGKGKEMRARAVAGRGYVTDVDSWIDGELSAGLD